jgi:PAS domain S-box-containing protein
MHIHKECGVAFWGVFTLFRVVQYFAGSTMCSERELNFYKNLIENSQALVFECDSQGRFTYLNHAWERTLGYPIAQMLGQPSSKFQSSEQAKQDFDQFYKLFSNGHALGLDTTYLHQSGRLVHLRFDVHIELDSTGNIVQAQGMALDITARIEAEQALKESEEKFRLHVENSFDVLFTLDTQGNFVYASPAWEKHFGFSAQSILGQSFVPLVHPDDIPALYQHLQQCLSSGQSLSSPPYRVKHADGRWVWFVANGTPITTTQGALQYCGVAHDITDELLDKALIAEKNQEMEHFTHVVSHDLRAPLLNIEGFSHQLQNDLREIQTIVATQNLSDEAKQKLSQLFNNDIATSIQFIHGSVGKMNTLIQGLMQVARAGRENTIRHPIEMNQLIECVLDDFQFQLQEIHAQVAIDPLPPCFGDEKQLNQLFSNLIGNAIKYRSPERPLHISISSHSNAYQNVYAVQDNGIGIPASQQERVWDIFYRIENCNEGEGLGLSIVKRIVSRHQGKVHMTSELGLGSTFFIELPTAEISNLCAL